jgi:hypothetical protein
MRLELSSPRNRSVGERHRVDILLLQQIDADAGAHVEAGDRLGTRHHRQREKSSRQECTPKLHHNSPHPLVFPGLAGGSLPDGPFAAKTIAVD